ncbi:hypothetical protein AX15_006494 [Amanita polypyramis BW_CC]|nr:hypothetical protein AX15_006494 [Amanita polypyramis BW_CC]
MLTLKCPHHPPLHLDSPAPHTPLLHLRTLIAQLIGLPPDGFKLIHAGALMKDDNAPLSAYHLRSNSTIVVLPRVPLVEPVKSQPPSRSEQSVISLIHAEIAKIRNDLTPSVEAFLVFQERDPPLPDRQGQEKVHTRLGELLLQSLLRLDGIATDGDWEDARRERKAAVREVQALLDRLDGGWAEMQKG